MSCTNSTANIVRHQDLTIYMTDYWLITFVIYYCNNVLT